MRLRPEGFAPDFENIRLILEKKRPKRPTVYEFFWSDALSARLAGVPAYPPHHSREDIAVKVRAYYNAGYDYANIHGSAFCFPTGGAAAADTRSLNDGAVITNRAQFDAYPWQDPEQSDYSRLADCLDYLPPGMKLIVHGPLGVLENVVALTGYEQLCMLLYDDEALVQDLFAQVGGRLLAYFQRCLAFPSVGAILVNDDWGFHSQTMLAPAQLRRLVFPWHRQIVAAAHAAGKYAILHSCGNDRDIREDIIEDMRYDGRHSFEDSILPVEQAYPLLQGRIAVMGGIDMDFMARATPQQVFARARGLLALTEQGGGYALGTGNSVADYIPDANFIAMVSAIWQDVL